MRRANRADHTTDFLLRLSDSFYQCLLVIYPPTFRRAYGAHMAQVFRDCCRATWNQRGGIALLGLWLHAFGDLVASALAERWQSSKAAYRAATRRRGIMARRFKFKRNLAAGGVMLVTLLVLTCIASFVPPIHLALFRIEPQVALALPGGQYYQMPGPGMQPTIGGERYVAVDGYGSSKPQRGDIIAFYRPESGNLVFIKRVIAIPGDTIDITATSVILNGVTLHEPYIKDSHGLPNNFAARVTHVTLAAGQYFVMGDNRMDSSDSRFYGPILLQNIIGKVVEISSFGG